VGGGSRPGSSQPAGVGGRRKDACPYEKETDYYLYWVDGFAIFYLLQF
jgi:ribosome modulation factor